MQVLRVSPVEPQPPRSHFLEPTLRLRGSSLSQGTLALDARSLLSPTVVSCCFTNVFVIKRRRRELPRVLGAFSSSKVQASKPQSTCLQGLLSTPLLVQSNQPPGSSHPPASQRVSCRVVLCCVVLCCWFVSCVQKKPSTNRPPVAHRPPVSFVCCPRVCLRKVCLCPSCRRGLCVVSGDLGSIHIYIGVQVVLV